MSPKPLMWQDEAACAGDSRFTARLDWLDASDLHEMDAMCGECPVFEQCNKWASTQNEDGSPAVVEVFAAGHWRQPKWMSTTTTTTT
ncbi:WhiB family transcription factor [Mycobacterium phage Archie]|uniref:WhiB family transcription factor n=1 Tax=Mycobacterium phage Archie TaxID=1718599 RepID=A0A0M5M0Q2_9CAUD|nr:transcriptional regulator WhiB-like [Mycobacterium phage Archie]ALF00376.1 WhiB family transcription factor [Mycobacterium phage Archie]